MTPDPLAEILVALWPDIETAWAAQGWDDPLRQMVHDGVLTAEQAGIVEVILTEHGEPT